MTNPPTVTDALASALANALATVDTFGASHAAAAVVGPGGVIAAHGDLDHVFAWASVSKVVTGLAVLTAIDDGRMDLQEAAPAPAPPGATVRHLLAHASGLPFDGEVVQGRPGARRIYSNTGFDLLGALLAERDERPFQATLRHRVLTPLGMVGTVLRGRPSQGLHGPMRDLTSLAGEFLRPTLASAATFATATHVVYEGLPGVLPGVGASTSWIGDSPSNCATARCRIGRGPGTVPAHSGTSAGPERSCGWTRSWMSHSRA